MTNVYSGFQLLFVGLAILAVAVVGYVGLTVVERLNAYFEGLE